MDDVGSERHALEAQRAKIPGCGIALYVGVLGAFFLLGLTGIAFSTFTILAASENASPFNLAYGGSIEPALLLPMRDAGILGEGEVPDAFHAENVTGSAACAIKGDEFIRLGPEGVVRMPLSAITDVEETDEGVRVVGTQSTFCPFTQGEGADRFARMLKPAAR